MSFRLAPKWVTLNDLERRNGRCIALFHEFDKHTFQHITATSICGGIYARVYCNVQFVYEVVVKKFTFAISSPDEFLVV